MPQAGAAPSQAPTAGRRLRAIGFVDALGTGLFLPLAVIYLTRVAGLSAERVGLGLGISGAVAVAATPLSGVLVDRHDARLVVLGCFGASAAAYVGYITVHSFAAFLIVAVVAQCASRMDRPAITALVVAAHPPQQRVVALAWQQTARNAGYGIGGLLAGVALLTHGRLGFDLALAANAISYLIAGGLVCTLHRLAPTSTEGRRGGFGEVFRDARYMRIALLNIAGGLHDSMLRVAMPLWLIARTAAPPAVAGPLFALNTILVVAFQLRVSRTADTGGGLQRAYRITAVAFLAAGIGFILASTLPALPAIGLLAAALIGLTIAEQHNSATEAIVSVSLAPDDLRGRYLSIFKTSIAAQQAIGPVVVTFALVGLGRSGWILITGIAATASLLSARLSGGPALTDSHVLSGEAAGR